MEPNYTVTTKFSEQQVAGQHTLSFEDFYAADFSFSQPFYLRFDENQILLAEKVVRMLPKKRMVVFGQWQGKAVVAKIFFDPKRAKRHQHDDRAGVLLLQKNKIPTPSLLYEGKTLDKRIYILIFERISPSANLEEVWQAKANIANLFSLLQAVVIEVATQHVLGLMQRDLHLRNFLITEKIIYTLDGAQIEAHPALLSKKMSMDNLALLLSQLGANSEQYQTKLFEHYAASRGWSLKRADFTELFALIRKWNAIRWQNFSKKIFRNSSLFIKRTTGQRMAIINRFLAKKELAEAINDPESIFTRKDIIYLKQGRSATVIKVRLDGCDYVIKRFNMKNFWHRARRAFRATRAENCWRLAQKLFLHHVKTPLPVALIENRFLGLRGVSYYISQYIPGDHIGTYFSRHFSEAHKQARMVEKVSLLLKSVATLEISHGDLKMTNILVETAQPFIIDLDGAKEHIRFASLRKTWQKELKRFLQNFSHQPNLVKQFAMEFQKWEQ